MKTVVAENKYGKYCVPCDLEPTRVECEKAIAGEVHEHDTIDAIIGYSKGNAIVHAGTFFGDMLPAFSQNFSKVYAFEPQSSIYQCAATTVQLNALDNVELAHCGLSSKQGSALIKIGNNQGKQTGSAARIVGRHEGVTENITITTIDACVGDEVIDVIHLDVEGQEYRALIGAKQTIDKHKPVIVLETRGGQLNDFKKLLIPRGYKLVGRTHPTANVPKGLNTIWQYNGE